jgi:hypothetical protein
MLRRSTRAARPATPSHSRRPSSFCTRASRSAPSTATSTSPTRPGTFKKGASGRITAFVKGGLAALFIKREIRLASQDVKANPTLCKAIAAPLGKIGDTVQAAFDKLKSGDASGVTNVNSLVSSVEGTSKTDGVPITENDNPDLTSTPK